MKNLLLLISICFGSVLFAQKDYQSYSYELNKEYIFKSGEVEMKVFLDAQGNAKVSRSQMKISVEKASFVFFEKGDEIAFAYDNFYLKDAKLGEKYWLIPFDTGQEIINMREISNVKVDCVCKTGNGSCSPQQVSGGGTVRLACVSNGCSVCEMQITAVGNAGGNYLMIKAESVQIAEK